VIETVGRTVGEVLGRFGVSPSIAPLLDAWPSAVGPEIARNAWPARIARNGTLLVHTSSAAWAFELAHLEQRLRSSLGDVAPPRMRFVVGPLPELETPAAAPFRAPLSPSAEEIAKGEQLASAIADENLRKVVAKAAALSLASAPSDRSL
jgi:hypothetical protein